MKLRLAQMWDHNGTNMEAVGFMYRNYQVLIALDADDNVKGIINFVAGSPSAVLHEQRTEANDWVVRKLLHLSHASSNAFFYMC